MRFDWAEKLNQWLAQLRQADATQAHSAKMRLGLPGLFYDDDGSNRHGYGNDAQRKHETSILHFPLPSV